jgi:NAD(P)-dependent dehydrogenase (short-subunit alcohol dehydrogenase family)
VTGTTSGIGKEVARGLLAAGFEVTMHGRDRERTEAAARDVRRSVPGSVVEVAVADLAVRSEVLGLAAELAARHPRVDVLVNNAAVVPVARTLTPDGIEQTLAVNVLAPLLLVRGLLPVLGPGSRVVGLYGGGQPNLDPDDLESEKAPFDGWNAYCQSKNAVAAVNAELARRHADTGVTFVAALPGIVYTEGMAGLTGRMAWFVRLTRWIMRTPAQGARTPVWLASSPELAGASGKVFGNVLGGGWRNELALPPGIADPAVQRRVWEVCERLVARDEGSAVQAARVG